MSEEDKNPWMPGTSAHALWEARNAWIKIWLEVFEPVFSFMERHPIATNIIGFVCGVCIAVIHILGFIDIIPMNEWPYE